LDITNFYEIQDSERILDLAHELGWVFQTDESGQKSLWIPNTNFLKFDQDELSQIHSLVIGGEWLGAPDSGQWHTLHLPDGIIAENCQKLYLSDHISDPIVLTAFPALAELSTIPVDYFYSNGNIVSILRATPNLKKLTIRWPLTGPLEHCSELAQLEEMLLVYHASNPPTQVDVQRMKTAFPKLKITLISDVNTRQLVPQQLRDNIAIKNDGTEKVK
jgi:hypothetical protein